MLNCHILFAAKSTANQGVLNLYLVSSKNHLAFVKGLMGRLIRRINKNVIILVDIGHCTLRLQKSMLGPRSFKMVRNYMFRIFNGFLCISPADMLVGADIIFLFIKYLGRIRGSSFLNISYRCKNLVFDFDQFFCLLCYFCCLSSNQGNAVAKIMSQPAYRNQRILIML